MTTTPFNVAIIGCGQFGYKRAKAVLACDHLKLVGVYDQSANQAQIISTDTNAHVYPTFASVLTDPMVDGVIICTPNYLHASQSTKALAAGKHVLCEKPAAITTADLESLSTVINANKKNNWQYGQNHRFFDSIQQVKNWLDQQLIGEVQQIEFAIHSGRNKSTKTWFANEQQAGGGTLIDNGHHLLDLLYWFLPSHTWRLCNVVLSHQPHEVVESKALITIAAKNSIAKISSYWETATDYLKIRVVGKTGIITATDHGAQLHTQNQHEECEYPTIPGLALQSELQLWVKHCLQYPHVHAAQNVAAAQKIVTLIQSTYAIDKTV